MRILYVNVIEQNAGWGAEVFVNKALRELGHETVCVDFHLNRHRLIQKFREAGDFDVLLLQRGDWFPLSLVRAVRRPCVFWASELLSRCKDQDHLIRSGLFSHVFLHGPICVRTAIERGWIAPDRVSALVNGYDPEVYRILPDTTKDIDVLFIGYITPRRARLLDALKRHCRLTVTKAFDEECARLFNRAKIVLNIHAEEQLDCETRVFEALGSGSFLLSEPLSEENPFRNGEHYVECRGEANLVEKIQYFLAHDDERTNIAAQGYAAAFKGHTYLARAKHIAGILERGITERGAEVHNGPPLDARQMRLAEIAEWARRNKAIWRRRVGRLVHFRFGSR